MSYVPSTIQRVAILRQRELLAEAEYARLVAQARSSNRPSSRKEISMPTLIAVKSLVQSLLLSPRAAGIAAVVLALVAGLLLGPQGADAVGAIANGR